MDNITSEGTDELFMDLESGWLTTEEGTSQSVVSGNRKEKNLVRSIGSCLLHFNGAVGCDNRVNAYDNLGEPSKVAVQNVNVVIDNSSGGEENEEHMALVEKQLVKEKHKKRNYRRAPKPPRPPKGPSLDAADLKLVKEISVITMKKHARNERLKKMKETKLLSSSPSSSSPSSSSPSSLSSSLSAMVISVLFILVILYQGFYSGGSPSVSFQGSPEPALATNSMISVQFYNPPSPNEGSGLGS